MQLKKGIELYLTAARQSGYSTVTLRQYHWHLIRMETWFTEKKFITEVECVSRDMLREWGAELYDQWGAATIKQATCAARAFFVWAFDEEWLECDIARALKVPHVPTRVQRTLTSTEIKTLTDACDPTTPIGCRNLAIVSLLTDSGLRAAEMCRLSVGKLYTAFGGLTVIGKGGDEEWAYFGNTTAQRLRNWLEVRQVNPSVETVFVAISGTRPGAPLTTRGLGEIVQALGKKVGIEGVCPHAFRRAFACLATEAGAPSRTIQKWGRWSNIEMVERYTAGLQAGQLYRPYSPIDFVESKHQEDQEQ